MEDETERDGAARPEPTLVLRIEPPIQHGAERWDSLELREPRVSEIRQGEELLGNALTPVSVLDSEMKLVAVVSGAPAEVVAQLGASVLNEASDYLAGFEAFGRAHGDDGPALLLTLDTPVEVQKGTFAEIALREPRVGERRLAEQHLSRGVTVATSRAAEVALVTAVSGLPPAVVLKLPISDFARGAEYLTRFFGRGRRTGANSRPT